ncbi:hypothetical protein N0V93_003191 [Gnomoniopsis smithogilvyi]|uniref:DUF6590 domain-containing protein n=1 Tax=Gnomoniopsis smithogilvyi TaxID=1191159 RepID=A0A9W9CZW2_9PEZI|nr:hypothetical protein N0V93_003191 [Gnomoniopsis smithogilvyi]
MGKNEFARTVTGSDSGYGDDVSERNSSSSLHPLSRKGYEIGPAAKLQIGDVFEFLWADCPEFEWEWKCLGYSRFIVLRHSDSFPHYCACVPISTGNKRDFAKPGVDTLQQGYVYASGDKERDRDGTGGESHHQSKNLPQLPYSSVGISLKSGRHRIKEDSRANYADVIEVDHEAQVMVIGDAVRYFDRVRKNVNKAFMRQVLREALGPYCQRKKSESAAAGVQGWGNSAVSLTKVPGQDKEQDRVQGDEGVEPKEKQAEHAQPDHVHVPQSPGATEKDLEDFFSDTTRDEEDWDRSPRSPAGFPPPSNERRMRRAASRARPPPDSNTTAVRPGMDKAGLSSLRTLRQGLPGGEDHDDTQSLRSLAMVGRSDSYTSTRSRR